MWHEHRREMARLGQRLDRRDEHPDQRHDHHERERHQHQVPRAEREPTVLRFAAARLLQRSESGGRPDFDRLTHDE